MTAPSWPDRRRPLRVGGLFAGYGGLEMGLAQVARTRPMWWSENEAAPSRILAERFPRVPNLGDITKIDWRDVEPVDVITGGFPCQDVSHAGKRAGLRASTRTGLWARMLDAVDVLRPALVVAENVRGLLSAEADSDVEPCPWCMGDGGGKPQPAMRALGAVLADLADVGYDAAWCGLRAADVGAPHGRFRVFVLAWPAADADRFGGERVGAARDGRAGPADGGRAPSDADRDGLESVRGLRAVGRDADRCRGAGQAAPVALLPTPAVNDAQQRVLDRIEVDPESGCWLWTGWTNQAATPYGRISIDGKKVYAHRAAYEAFIGPIPGGHEIDHLCQSSLCVNPEHLEAVTPEENRDRVTRRRTRCKRGHEFTEENTYWVRPGARACRACRAWQDKVDKARRKGEEFPLLPTPACNDMGAAYTPEQWDEWTARMRAAHGNGNGHGPSLAVEALRMLPTPSVADVEGGRASRSGDRSGELLLNGIAAAQAFGQYAPAVARWEAVLGRPAPAPTEPTGKGGGHRLSPRFVEFLMGLPDGWVTDVPGVTRNHALKALGNGVVPQQAAAAIRHLLTLRDLP